MVSTWKKIEHCMPGAERLAGKIGVQTQLLNRKISLCPKPHKLGTEGRLLGNRKSMVARKRFAGTLNRLVEAEANPPFKHVECVRWNFADPGSIPGRSTIFNQTTTQMAGEP